jgi:predicted nucleotidyltransferase
MNIVEQNIQSIAQVCLLHQVDRLYIFGSLVNGGFDKQSDIDLLVSFGAVNQLNYFDNYLDMKEELEKLLCRSVDLVEDQTVRNPVLRRTIDRNKKLIYGRAS